MIKERVVRWTKGQVAVVAAFAALVWFGDFSVLKDGLGPADPKWLGVIGFVLFLGIPILVARILFVWFGKRD